MSSHFKNLSDPMGYLVSEIGFIDVILAPLFEAANEFMKHGMDDVMDNLKTTRETYEKRLEDMKAAAASKEKPETKQDNANVSK